MDKSSEQVLVFDFEMRERIPTSAINLSRDSSMASSGHLTPYHERMDNNMDCSSTMGELTPELFYKTKQEKVLRVSKVTDQQETTRPMGGYNKTPLTHASNKESIINIQLLYDIQAPTKSELWSKSFHPISLHSLIEHFVSDAKNIKVTLNFLAKYIKNKQVNDNRANQLDDFDRMGDAIWHFISSVYEAKWDSLYTDKKTNTLRAKISSKFTLRTSPTNNSNKKELAKPVLVTINKVPLPPPLLAKTKKEINIISKYFHSNKLTGENKNHSSNSSSGKSYTQASKPSTNTSEVLKIKETFLSLNAKKIN